MSNVLMLSNSTIPGQDFFGWPQSYVNAFLKNGGKKLLFVPFAAVTFSFDEYADKVKEVFTGMGYRIQGIHSLDDKYGAIAECDGVVVGGGNTFALLKAMYDHKLIEAIQTKVSGGVPYIGWSAGANVACPTIKTTNDMPIVQPPSFIALNLVPFQINPHYHELKFEGQGGETRKERLGEFVTANPAQVVIGLPEGMGLQRTGSQLRLFGSGLAKLYRYDRPITGLRGNSDVSFLLDNQE